MIALFAADNAVLILRSARSARLEGWRQAPSLPPSFETARFAGLLRMRTALVYAAASSEA